MTPPPLEDITGDTPVKMPLKTAIFILVSVISLVSALLAVYYHIEKRLSVVEMENAKHESRLDVIEEIQNKGRR